MQVQDTEFHSRFPTVERLGKRAVYRARCFEVFPDECPHFECGADGFLTEQPCQEWILDGHGCPAGDCSDNHTCGWNFDSWDDALAWLNGDDAKGCDCGGECHCGRFVDAGSAALCVCGPCPKHPMVAG